jgi:predicted ATPase/serine/threonine protein kinase
VKTDRWKQIETVFHAALERQTDERGAFLDRACAGDVSLRHDIESLLAAFENADGILEQRPAIDAAFNDVLMGALRAHAAETPGADSRRTTARMCPVCSVLYDEGYHMCSVDGEALVEDPMALAGTLIDGLYQVEKLIGRGGMGAVYLARHTLLGDRVAVKVLPRAVREDPEWLARFMREGRAARAIRHPNAVTVHELRTSTDGLTYMVLEYVEGQTLRAEIRDRDRLTPAEALAVLEPVAGALDVAHAHGIVHRDLKPENIMLGTAGVKLLDLGIAKFRSVSDAATERVDPENDATLTQPGQWMGTPRYMPPEQWGDLPRDGNAEIDGRADVYGLGVVAYELVTGRAPVSGRTLGELRKAHASSVPQPVNKIIPDVPEEFARAIARALSKDRADRQASAGAFVAELRASLRDEVAATGAPNNLPQPTTSFVGREQKVAEVRESVERDRLVTLVGPGGIGKTRLTLEVARSALGSFRDGVWFVELAGLSEPGRVAPAVAAVLDIREEGHRPLIETVCDALKPKELLLVIDNCEHVVEACAEIVDAMLHASEGLRVLATSREVLGVGGEAVWPVPPLMVPASASVEDLEPCEAVRLFVDRARLGRPDFTLTARNAGAIGELCRRLEGIPLAVELAAARVRVLPVEQVVEKMDDRFRLLTGGSRRAVRRQQTLRATIDWSYDLLTAEERALLRRLSVFAGGWTLEAAEAVACGPARPRTTPEILDLLTHLVDKSLVTTEAMGGRMRYRMLETIRQYAREKLLDVGEAEAALRAHRDWFLELAYNARSEFYGPRQSEWLEVFEAEHDNLRAAIAWSLRVARDVEESLRLTVAMRYFWHARGHWTEGRHLTEEALALGKTPPALRADALFGLATLAELQADNEYALTLLEECVALCRSLGDDEGIARANTARSRITSAMGKYEVARTLLEETLTLCRKLGNAKLINKAMLSLGQQAMLGGDLNLALSSYEEALTAYRHAGDKMEVAWVLANIGDGAWLQGDFDRAERTLKESRAMALELSHDYMVAWGSDVLGRVLTDKGDYDSAASLFEEAIAIFRNLPLYPELIDVIESTAFAAARRDDRVRAVCLAEAAAHCRRAMRKPLEPVYAAALERRIGPVREALTAEQIEQARARGQAMTLEAAVDYALETLSSLKAPRPRP